MEEKCEISLSKDKYLCEIANIEQFEKKIIFIGDSHTWHFYHGLSVLSNTEILVFIFQLPTHCNIVNEYPSSKKCNEIITQLKYYIEKNKIDKIAFSYKWSNYNNWIGMNKLKIKLINF